MYAAPPIRIPLVLCLTLSIALPSRADILYVDVDAPGPIQSGASWCEAYVDLQDALEQAVGGDEIRVAQGTYRPDGGSGDRDATFMIVRDVALLGGYAGCGAADPDQRDTAAFETILSGDLNGDDGPGFINNAENCYHIMTNIDLLTDEGTVVDGLTIRGGNANGSSAIGKNQGAALHNHWGQPQFTGRLTVNDCRFEDNWADNHAALNDHGGATITNCVFARNHADGWGGALYVHNGIAAHVEQCQFIDNTTAGLVGGGAAVFLQSSVEFVSCHFSGNVSDRDGAAVYALMGVTVGFDACTFTGNEAWNKGGAVYAESGTLVFSECTFTANHAIGTDGASNGSGGAVWAGAAQFESCVFVDNSAQALGGAVYASGAVLRSSQFKGNVAAVGGGARLVGPSALVIGCTFDDNVADSGAGCDLVADVATLVNCRFRRNSAESGGALAIERGVSDVVNCEFHGNTAATHGGGVAWVNSGVPAGAPVLNIMQSTFVQNSAAPGTGHALHVSSTGMDSFGEVGVYNSILWDGPDAVVLDGANGTAALTATHCNVAGSSPGWPAGRGNIDADPHFADLDGPDDVPLSDDDDLGLAATSPCRDAGLGDAVPQDMADLDGDEDTLEALPFDLAGAPRVLDAGVDMGAYEYNCDIGPGAGGDCNSNGIPDRCDIAAGRVTDGDGNGVPDDCEACAFLQSCADVDEDGIRDDACVWWGCATGACTPVDIRFGDMGGQFNLCTVDGAVDANDRFHALNCFADTDPGGAFYPCELGPPAAMNVDAGGAFGSCAPDGVCDGNDAFHAINAFGGSTTCACPLDGTPHPVTDRPRRGPVFCGRTEVTATPAGSRVAPGGLIEVDIHLAGALPDLRGYQLHMAARGGDRGHLELVDVVIAPPQQSAGSAPHPFAKLPFWKAFNVATGQIVAGLDRRGVATAPHVYLATCVYRATPDARGTFYVDVLHDPLDPAVRTFLFPTPQTGLIDIRRTQPAVIPVSR